MAKFSLASQIAEINYELEQRKNVYPRIAQKEPRRAGELDLRIAVMRSVKETLEWLRDNETDVRSYIASKKKGAAA